MISAVLAFVLFLILDGIAESEMIKTGEVWSYARAILIIAVFYIAVRELRPFWNKNRGMRAVYVFLTDSGKFSLQLYLFNGYLLTIIRIVVCQFFHITDPAWIVLSIWGGNMAVTLIACKWIIPRIPILRELCGLTKR